MCKQLQNVKSQPAEIRFYHQKRGTAQINVSKSAEVDQKMQNALPLIEVRQNVQLNCLIR